MEEAHVNDVTPI